ncbi:DUF3732 domain-containing protein [Mycoplasmatota bacterium]|nr:DUF3732 domain-containing protein [Mycoplasmatota bacterium]
MKFHIKKIVLWKKDGTIKTHNFKNNKINIIKGSSNTGKSSFFSVLDYCFLSSGKDIPSEIDRQVNWYGIEFKLNDQNYFIGRESGETNKASNNVYFSNFLPKNVDKKNSSIKNIKEIINKKFNLDSEKHRAYGGPATVKNSKLSYRPFLLFNTISQEIISSKDQFFDKLNNRQYLGTFPAAMDIALGIYTLDKLELLVQKKKLEDKLNKINNDDDNESNKYHKYIDSLFKEASELGVNTLSCTSLGDLREQFNNNLYTSKIYNNDMYRLKEKEFKLIQKLRSLESYNNELNKSERLFDKEEEENNVIKYFDKYKQTSLLAEYFIEAITEELMRLKKDKKLITEIRIDVNERIKVIKESLDSVQKDIKRISNQISLENNYKDYIELLGKIKIIDFISKNEKQDIDENNIKKIEKELKKLEKKLEKYPNKDSVLFDINEILNENLEKLKVYIKGYENKNLKAFFNMSKKKLEFKLYDYKEILGSESNFMIEHLLLFTSLHQYAKDYYDKFILSFLVIDYLSKPYNVELPEDLKTFKGVLSYLCIFLKNIKDFQLIIIDKLDYQHYVDKDNKQLIYNLNFDTLV